MKLFQQFPTLLEDQIEYSSMELPNQFPILLEGMFDDLHGPHLDPNQISAAPHSPDESPYSQSYSIAEVSDGGSGLASAEVSDGGPRLASRQNRPQSDLGFTSLEFQFLEHNDTISDAVDTGIVGPGNFFAFTGIGDNLSLAPNDDVDLFELQLTLGDNLVVDIDAITIGSNLDSVLSIFDSTGTLVAQNDDIDILDSFIDFTATATDTYYIGVSSFANFSYDPFVEGSGVGNSSGFYTLTVDVTAAPSLEPNDTIPDAVDTGIMGSGDFSVVSEIGNNPSLAPEDDVDLFELQLDAGDQLIVDIDADALGTGLDPILTVYDSAGTLIAKNDDFDGLDSFIDFTASTTDTYYVGVSSFSKTDFDPFVEGSGNGNSAGAYTLSMEVNDASNISDFDIELVFFDDSLTPSQQTIFAAAAKRWEQIIIDDIPDVFVTGFGLIDDVLIGASAPLIDGVGGILGQAGPIALRNDGSFLPSIGVMEFDSADLINLETSGALEDVILHEMGHVLGIGTIWEALGLLTGVGTDDPRFIGAGATAEYNDIFGVEESSIPVEADGGPGTAFGHWDDELFFNELMTGFLSPGDNPLSRITVASLGDLGYGVDLSAADPYTPPSVFG